MLPVSFLPDSCSLVRVVVLGPIIYFTDANRDLDKERTNERGRGPVISVSVLATVSLIRTGTSLVQTRILSPHRFMLWF